VIRETPYPWIEYWVFTEIRLPFDVASCLLAACARSGVEDRSCGNDAPIFCGSRIYLLLVDGVGHLKRIDNAKTFKLGGRDVRRMGYGAMQLAGPGVFGPPKDRAVAVAVLRAAIESGVDHIDTSDFYGPHIVNEIIREALAPYPDHLTIVSKLGARRGVDGAWLAAMSREELIADVHSNLRNLGLDRLEVVNLRSMLDVAGPVEGSLEEQITVLAELQRKELIGHIGLSNVTSSQVAEGRGITDIACVQNMYNVVHRHDDELIDVLAQAGIAYVPFFPLGGFTPLQSSTLDSVAAQHGVTTMQVALAWLLQRSPNILLIPGTSSVGHLRDNLNAVTLDLLPSAVAELNSISGLST
jgi:pyridoxine 4-dehydrogenase